MRRNGIRDKKKYGNISSVIETIGALMWLVALVISVGAMWGAPPSLGFVAYFGVAAAFFDATKESLGGYSLVFTRHFFALPAKNKLMAIAVLFSTLVNVYFACVLVR